MTPGLMSAALNFVPAAAGPGPEQIGLSVGHSPRCSPGLNPRLVGRWLAETGWSRLMRSRRTCFASLKPQEQAAYRSNSRVCQASLEALPGQVANSARLDCSYQPLDVVSKRLNVPSQSVPPALPCHFHISKGPSLLHREEYSARTAKAHTEYQRRTLMKTSLHMPLPLLTATFSG